MDYARAFVKALQRVKDEGRYRVFADIRRNRGQFPSARHFAAAGPRQITVWCSNDYLGMAQHPAVIAAMHEALDTAGAGSGGTRNISGTSHYHVELEAELADLHPPHRATLLALRDEIKSIAGQITSRTHVAARLSSAVLGHLNTVVRLLAGAVEKAGLYTKHGVPSVSSRIGVMEAVG